MCAARVRVGGAGAGRASSPVERSRGCAGARWELELAGAGR